jgi:probable phosphoglycerate mutase
MLILLRHGRTVANASRLLQGRVDHPLDEHGVLQASAQAAAIGPVDRILSSPLLRAVQTAEAVAARSPGVEIEVDERFVELSYGEWEDRPLSDVPAEEWARWRKDPDYAPPGGETLATLDARVRAACEHLVPAAEGERVVVCSHVSPIKSAVVWALDVPYDASWRMHLDTGSRCHIAIRAGAPVLAAFNITVEVG